MGKFIKLISKNYTLALFVLVFISYGQILFMQPWQEDNVIFFKVAHINEQAGYLGKGILGEGPYRHTITPYYLLYKIFGYNIPVFYSLMLLSYFFATVSVYFLVKEILGKKAGMMASFLFGAGYIASEGFFRVYTSTNISSGIGFTALLFLAFWRFYKSKELKWYLLTVLLYFLTIQISYVRVHYLILPLLTFDFLFLVLPKLQNLKWFILRSIPFLLIFREFYIIQGDSRREGIVEVGKALLQGKFEYLSSFLGSFGNLIMPDFFQKSPVQVGAVSLLVFFVIAFKFFSGEKRKLFIFLSTVIISNILAYSVYTPFTIYVTNYRYLAHSFFALCIILSLFTLSKKRIITYLVVLWGLMFLILNVRSQNMILSDRTVKIKSFYESLKRELPEIPKDSAIYFDVQDSDYARDTFKVSFSVAEMPETTAIAWRYGIDRYDFKMFTDYSEFSKDITDNNTPPDKVFSFWLSDKGLFNTSEKLRDYLNNKSQTRILCSDKVLVGSEVDCLNRIESLTPLELNITLSASPSLKNHTNIETSNPIHKNIKLMDVALSYGREKKKFLETSVYTASSFWKDRGIDNLHDGDTGTIWQSDRIEWGREETGFTITLPYPIQVDKLIWIPAHQNNVPTDFKIETSSDGIIWREIDSTPSRFVRMKIFATSGGDSPQIAEAWVVPSKYSSLEVSQMEDFLKSPFAFVSNQQSFDSLVVKLGREGKIKIFWKGDKSPKPLSEFESVLDVVYDGKVRTYSMIIPPGGTFINSFKFEGLTIPGDMVICRISAIPAKAETP